MKNVAVVSAGVIIGMLISDLVTGGDVHRIITESVEACINNKPAPPPLNT